MNDKILQITGQRDHTISKALEYWMETSVRFTEFVHQYKEKIRKKCHSALTYEDLEDVRFELEIPYLILQDNRFYVEYEKYGQGKLRSPDFTVAFEDSFEFNIEVKRIREHNFGQRYDEWRNGLVDEIREIPSSLAFSIDMVATVGTEDLIDTLEENKAAIIQFIKKTIIAEESNIKSGSHVDYVVPNINTRLVVTLSKPPRKVNALKTSYHGGIEPIFYTNKEHFKLGDSIFEKLGQMIAGMANVLVCSSNSSTHERDDLIDAIQSINSLISEKEESFFIRKGFKGTQDFLSHTKNLSGIVFRSTWSDQGKALNFLWCNKQAEHQMPEQIKKHLSEMTAIYP